MLKRFRSVSPVNGGMDILSGQKWPVGQKIQGEGLLF